MNSIDIRIWPSVSRYPKGGWEHAYTLPDGGKGGGGHRNVTLDQAKSLISTTLAEMGYADYQLNFIVGDMVFTPLGEHDDSDSA